MSGIEIAGLVLAVLPIMSGVLRSYANTFLGKPRYKDRLIQLARGLEIQTDIFQAICRRLLECIEPSHDRIASIIENPSVSGAWKDQQFEHQLLLWDSYQHFGELVERINRAILELQKKLSMDDSKPTLMRKARCAIKQHGYEDCLRQITEGNTALLTIAVLNPESRFRRQSRYNTVSFIREVYQSVYRATFDALKCECSHKFNLELQLRDLGILPCQDRAKVARDLGFNFAIWSLGHPKHRDVQGPASSITRIDNWVHLKIQARNSEPSAQVTATACISQSSPDSGTPEHDPSQFQGRLKLFRSPSRSKETIKQLVDALSRMQASQHPSVIRDLCAILCQSESRRCYGYIIADTREFAIYSPQESRATWSSVTLETVLKGGCEGLSFDYTQKRKAAHALAAGVLNLYGTAWIGKVITVENILFFAKGSSQNEDSQEHANRQLSAPYQPICRERQQDSRSGSVPRLRPDRTSERPVTNLAVFSLGTVLIQVMLGGCDESLKVTSDMDWSALWSIHTRGWALCEGNLSFLGGSVFVNAVKWCLNSPKEDEGLQDVDFLVGFHENVVAPLWRDLQREAKRTSEDPA